jgi:DNA-binding response OmpR family regulator
MTRVLLVDDDAELSAMLAEYLQMDGFDPHFAGDGEEGVREALSGHFDIVVLDVMMPRLNGVEALRRIRAGSRIPVLMLTARGDDVDRIVGLELGADDYVAKPCSPRELAARLRAILRRMQPQEEAAAPAAEILRVGRLTLWPAQRRSQWGEAPLELTGAEYNLLEVLARQAGRVVGKQDLSQQGLGRPLARFDRSIDVHISSIRQKLSQASGGAARIETVRGMGYQLLKV